MKIHPIGVAVIRAAEGTDGQTNSLEEASSGVRICLACAFEK
jgi:hypothetical protein